MVSLCQERGVDMDVSRLTVQQLVDPPLQQGVLDELVRVGLGLRTADWLAGLGLVAAGAMQQLVGNSATVSIEDGLASDEDRLLRAGCSEARFRVA